MVHFMKKIEMLLSHIRDKNKFKNMDSISFSSMFQGYFLLQFLFNVLRLYIYFF